MIAAFAGKLAVAVVLGFSAGFFVERRRLGGRADAERACAGGVRGGLNLTHLVVATGSSTTGPNGGDLILGRSGSGTFSLTGGGGNDWIVAGGGPGTTNTIDGGNGNDVCIGAPGARNKFKNCEATF